MKKNYQAPEISIANVQLQQMIASSAVGIGGDYNGDAIQSRRGGSAWDDDDEE